MRRLKSKISLASAVLLITALALAILVDGQWPL